MKKVIISTSTFKSDENDMTPDFINSMIDSLSHTYNDLNIIVFRPMKDRYEKEYYQNNYKVVPYRYHWSIKKQTLWKYGLKPSYDIDKKNIFKIIFLFISQFFALIKLVKKEKPDVIYSQWFLPQAFVTAMVNKVYSVKSCFSTYGADVRIVKNIPFFGKRIINFVVKNTDQYSAISSLNLDIIISTLNKNLKNKKNYKIIPLPIDEIFFKREVPKKQEINKLNFLSIGRLIEVKGIDLLIDAFSNFEFRDKDITLNIVGDGVDKAKLIEMSKKLKLSERVLFHGWKSNEEKLKFYDKANVVFITSKQNNQIMEGGPLTLIEAMSQKLICICSDSVGYAEHIVDGHNGLIFKSGSSESLIDAINRYLGLSEEDIELITNNALKTSKKFKREEITKEIYDYFFNT